MDQYLLQQALRVTSLRNNEGVDAWFDETQLDGMSNTTCVMDRYHVGHDEVVAGKTSGRGRMPPLPAVHGSEVLFTRKKSHCDS